MAENALSYQLKGFAELERKLKAFQGNSARRILTRASRASMSETRKRAKSYARRVDDPKTREKIWKNVVTTINSKRFSSRGYIVAKVGVRGGAKHKQADNDALPGGDTWHWRFSEFGTSRQPARPFLRASFHPEQVQQAFATALAASIAKEIQKYGAPK